MPRSRFGKSDLGVGEGRVKGNTAHHPSTTRGPIAAKFQVRTVQAQQSTSWRQQFPAYLLITAVRDPHDPRLRGACLIGSLETGIRHRYPNDKIRANLSARHDLWNALVLLVTTKRTSEQKQRPST
ncbi:hypothetical protein Hypma_001386 [Hypsizygus marmoreus]|uniref:Uncharacterized protein n=1 Tax=Hypsizygus marmoreus TaxID=39966 RepID=A0A369K936_HYPMA|nr:hypothetical protein Hypma_001386 [Hypsizygus marmoreus]